MLPGCRGRSRLGHDGLLQVSSKFLIGLRDLRPVLHKPRQHMRLRLRACTTHIPLSDASGSNQNTSCSAASLALRTKSMTFEPLFLVFLHAGTTFYTSVGKIIPNVSLQGTARALARRTKVARESVYLVASARGDKHQNESYSPYRVCASRCHAFIAA